MKFFFDLHATLYTVEPEPQPHLDPDLYDGRWGSRIRIRMTTNVFMCKTFTKKLNLPVPGTRDSTVYVVVQFKCGKQLLIYLSSEIKLTCLVWPSCWQQQRTAVGQQLTSPHHHSCGATYQGLSHGQHSPTWHHELQKWDLKPIWTYAISTIADLF